MNDSNGVVEPFYLYVDYTDFLKLFLDKLVIERKGKHAIRELMIHWVIEHKLFGTYLPKDLEELSHLINIPFPKERQVNRYNLIEVRIKRGTLVLMFSGEERGDNDSVLVNDIKGVGYIHNLSDLVARRKELTNKASVYLISVHESNEYYVGSTYNTFKRLSEHVNRLKANEHHAEMLQLEYKDTGGDLSSFSVIVFELFSGDKEDKLRVEQEFFNFIKRKAILLNRGVYAYSPSKGVPVKDTSREKMRLSSRMKLHSLEVKMKMSQRRKGRRNYSEESLLVSVDKRRKPIMGDGVLYKDAYTAATLLKRNQSSINRRVGNPNYPGWFYVGSQQDPDRDVNSDLVKKSKKSKGRTGSFLVNGVYYDTAKEVGKHYAISEKTVHRRCSADPIDYPLWKEWLKMH